MTTAGWQPYDSEHVRKLAEQASSPVTNGERMCPACAVVAVRTYRYFSSRGTTQTMISYVWCANCHRYVGATGPRPRNLVLDDPLTWDDHVRYEQDLRGLLDRLDELWDQGRLPQTAN
jgi:hypothetical protein